MHHGSEQETYPSLRKLFVCVFTSKDLMLQLRGKEKQVQLSHYLVFTQIFFRCHLDSTSGCTMSVKETNMRAPYMRKQHSRRQADSLRRLVVLAFNSVFHGGTSLVAIRYLRIFLETFVKSGNMTFSTGCHSCDCRDRF